MNHCRTNCHRIAQELENNVKYLRWHVVLCGFSFLLLWSKLGYIPRCRVTLNRNSPGYCVERIILGSQMSKLNGPDTKAHMDTEIMHSLLQCV